VIFLLVKAINTVQRKKPDEPPAAPPEPTPSEALLTEIRDLLKARG
jgi:large conductance mechanosensitive channel